MRRRTLDGLIGLTVVGACVGCGTSPAYEAKTPGTVMVVPADRVVEKCPCDEQVEQAPPQRKSVEYVQWDEWQSPPAAQRAESFIAANPNRFRASAPPPPALLLHQPIPETRFAWMGPFYGPRRFR